MRSAAEKLYISRKRGRGMGLRYVISALLPLLLLLLVTSVLSFALVFIFSMSSQIDRMIALLGSGTVYSLEDPGAFIPEGSEVSASGRTSALLYSEGGESAVLLKGVEDGYFSGMRAEELDIRYNDGSGINPIIISSALARELSLSPRDRLTLLVWEGNRARPFLCTVSGIYESIYPQLDSHLVFSSLDMTGPDGYEILLPRGEDENGLVETLWNNGIPAQSYRTLYSSIYSNVRESIGILYVILLAVALLAAFFSSDAAQVYIDRDRKDIKEMWMLGLGRQRIKAIYFRLTLSAVAFSAVLGAVIGLLLAFLSPLMLSAIARTEPALLEYYVTSFRIVIPYPSIILMVIVEIAVSGLSITFSLRRKREMH